MSDSLDLEVATALNRAGIQITTFHRISTTHASDGGRSVYRLELDSGRIIKARRVENEKTAYRQFEMRRELPDAFAPAFGCYGAVLLEEWICGEELRHLPPSDARLVEAGSLLATLHATAHVAGYPIHEIRSTAVWRHNTEANLCTILAAGGLDEQDTLRIRGALERRDPKQAVVGLVHTDFCGENMVIDREDRLRVVDNERVGIDALGYDLARTWYRWALPSPAWDRFRSAYTARIPFTDPVETLDFWSVVVLAQSAALRLRQDQARAHMPLSYLRQMATGYGR